MRFKINSIGFLISTTVPFILLLNIQSSFCQYGGGGGSMQYLNFYNSSDCRWEPLESINSTQYNLTVSNALSMAVNGVWEVSFCRPSSNVSACSSAVTYVSSQGTCVTIDKTLNYTDIQAVRYGDQYQSNGTISLFGSKQFTDVNAASPVDTKGLNFTSPMTIGSWYFTGNHEWGLYEGINYTGKETCLKPSKDVISKGYGFTYELVTNLTINSVGYRCTGGTSGANHLKLGELYHLIVLFILFISFK